MSNSAIWTILLAVEGVIALWVWLYCYMTYIPRPEKNDQGEDEIVPAWIEATSTVIGYVVVAAIVFNAGAYVMMLMKEIK